MTTPFGILFYILIFIFHAEKHLTRTIAICIGFIKLVWVLLMLYTIINGYVHVQPILPLVYSSSNGTTRGHHNKFLQPAARTDVYKYSFFPTAVKLWNNLPIDPATTKSLDDFKNLLLNIKGTLVNL